MSDLKDRMQEPAMAVTEPTLIELRQVYPESVIDEMATTGQLTQAQQAEYDAERPTPPALR
jgi:hypothetical protein